MNTDRRRETECMPTDRGQRVHHRRRRIRVNREGVRRGRMSTKSLLFGRKSLILLKWTPTKGRMSDKHCNEDSLYDPLRIKLKFWALSRRNILKMQNNPFFSRLWVVKWPWIYWIRFFREERM